jgi:hypothetical protein
MLMRGMMEGTRKLKPWSVSIYGCISFLSVCGSCSCKRLNTVSQISTRTQMSRTCAHTPAHAGL